MTTLHKCRSDQGGSALIISLVFLLLLSAVGIASIQNSTLEERMAGNAADKSDAFQMAEATLRYAEMQLATNATPFVNTTDSTLTIPTTDVYPSASDWKSYTSLLNRKNYYRIQRFSQPLGSNDAVSYNYRITAIGYGAEGASSTTPSSTRVVLQSTFQP